MGEAKIKMKEEGNVEKKKWSNFAKFNLVFLTFFIIIAIIIIVIDPGNMTRGNYGAGDYYYTDLEGFENIFYNINLGTKKPFLFFALFFAWGLICWFVLKYLDKKL